MKNFTIASGLIVGGALAISGAPAQAILVYSGLQNISLTKPVVPGSNNIQSIELFTNEFADFGWVYEETFQALIFSIPEFESSLIFKFDYDSPYSLGQLPYFNDEDSLLILGFCDIPNLANCYGWEEGTQFLAYRYENNYGWARISMPGDISDANATTTLVDWAYQTDPNILVPMGEGIPTEEVPVPLPVMGAAAAFAASRRLRRRTQGKSKS